MLQKLASLCFGGAGFSLSILVAGFPIEDLAKAVTQVIIAVATLIALFRKKKPSI